MKNSVKRLIGLTGGIGTGKTTVSNYLAKKYHLPILDADIYAKEAVAKDSSILNLIFNRYGDRLKLPDNSLDRAALGEIIFNQPKEKQWLESQIHPYVRDRFERELLRLQHNTIVLVIPLLFEAKLTDIVTEVWVVSCDRDLQIDRLRQRNGLSPEQAIARIDSQLPLSHKIAKADIVINNNSDLEYLYRQIDRAVKLSL
jgi:dephospho-CoA kinase